DLRLYKGGYSDFEAQYAEEQAQQQAAYEKQQKEIARIQRFVDRFRAQASKARQAQSRLKALERMEQVAPAHGEDPFQFSFLEPARLPQPLLGLKKISAGYGDEPVLCGVNLELYPGDRIGLLGPSSPGSWIPARGRAIPTRAWRWAISPSTRWITWIRQLAP
ncbi:MAG: hypothetical protein ABEJ96_02190, partial [Thiohalorhabdaceae bacterium]